MDPALKRQGSGVLMENFGVRFYDRAVLQNIDLALPADGITVIIGPSGAGKTTLLRALNRLNECYPGYSGRGRIEVILNGTMRDIHDSGLPVTELRRRVGMVFQTPNVLPTSIARNIDLPLKLVTDLDKGAREARLVEVLQEVHLWPEVKDRLRENASRLSGGQQQRLCLARILALNPEVLLLDEPTASLDYKTTQKIEDLLIELRERYKIIAVSHSLRQARKIADQLVVMNEGRIAHQLRKAEFTDAERLQEFLEEIF